MTRRLMVRGCLLTCFLHGRRQFLLLTAVGVHAPSIKQPGFVRFVADISRGSSSQSQAVRITAAYDSWLGFAAGHTRLVGPEGQC